MTNEHGMSLSVCTDLTRLADIVAAEVDKHDVLSALLLIAQQLSFQGLVALGGLPSSPRPCQRPAQAEDLDEKAMQ